ncbi:hypothetical protein OSB04_022341 [Centaurea solstitialis]|uniref:Uncharacterized protein n=1 Tax=Centaurea solstitialis TaxID=347529 RepID=A0AA38T3R5_9ASTR|nr:hypothetical protein OSB04_022341 [Centaurea solstitialis]
MNSNDEVFHQCFNAVHKLVNESYAYLYGPEMMFLTDGILVNISYDDLSSFDTACIQTEKYVDISNKYSGPTVWIGIYIAIASAICIIAMAADLFHGFRNRKFWFPCKYFSLNAASITVITVAMKLPVDLSSPMPGHLDQAAKVGSMAFMCVMMANLMPSLASMDNKTLLANIIGLTILVITVIVNICIQIFTGVITNWPISTFAGGRYYISLAWAYVYMVLMFLLLIILISSSITIPTSKKILEFKYQAKSKTTSVEHRVDMSTIEKLRQSVRRYWVMAESGNPQFVMASNPLSNASGIICVITLVTHLVIVLDIYFTAGHGYTDYQSDYKWSTLFIFITQFIGVVVGSIAPIFRCFTVLRFKLLTRNHLMVLKVEKYWTQMLCGWKESRLPFLSTARRSRGAINNLKNIILSLCILFQNAVVVSCKMIGLIVFIILVVCYYCWKSMKKLCTTRIASGSDDTSGDLSNHVLQIQDEMEFAEITVKGISNSMNRLIQKSRNENHNDLLKLLEKSTCFSGIEKFDIDQVQSLLSVEPVNSWSLPVVTLTCIVVALPIISKDDVKSLLKGVCDSLSYTYRVEESLNSASEYVSLRRATMNLWHEVEDSRKWLGNTLERSAYTGKTSAEILKWFADKAKEIVMKSKESINDELMESFPNKLIVANSMYRIATTILLNYQSSTEPVSDEQLFMSLSCMISDILCACLSNIPQVISTKCHESVIEKREASVHAAAKLFGRSTEIIEKLEARELPSMDPKKMAFIDEWRLYLKQSIP